jgi:hypothetical protein
VEVMPKSAEYRRSWRVGLMVVLATLGHGVAVQAQGVGTTQGAGNTQGVGTTQGAGNTQGVGTANVRTSATPPRSARLSYNRLTTGRQYVVSTSTRPAQPGGPPVASGSTAQGDSLHPYSDQMIQAQALRATSEVPSSSTQQPQPESQPVEVRSTPPRNYYPGMRTGRYPNANTAQISRRGGVGAPHICVPSRGSAMAGGISGR